jgi:broad specificity phosphatase PhoE
VESVLSSPLLRARDTAKALFPKNRVEVVEELIEVSLGEWDGLAWPDVERRDPELAKRKLTDWFGVPAPGGEEGEAVMRRAARALEIARAAPSPVAIVAHAGINAVLWNLMTGSPAITFRQAYLEVKTHEMAD